jgi:hypothetical protein
MITYLVSEVRHKPLFCMFLCHVSLKPLQAEQGILERLERDYIYLKYTVYICPATPRLLEYLYAKKKFLGPRILPSIQGQGRDVTRAGSW